MISKALSLLYSILNKIKMPIPIEIEQTLIHFKLSEFDSPDELGSGSKMDRTFLSKLDTARSIAGIPFKINSGFRSEKWNLKCGGRWGSAHKFGLAADIATEGSRECYLIVNALMQVGINRIGIGETFIHADISEERDQEVIWLYK